METMESLHLLAEAVRGAGADIAPTYQEYMQLAFAVANDCGEAGRADFHTLCSPSPKYDRQAADKLFGNALKSGRDGIHLGTAFHLARLCGVEVQPPMGTVGTVGTGASPASHTHAHARGNNEEEEEGESPRWQRPADTPAHLRPASPLAPPAGTHHGVRHLACPVRRAPAGRRHRAGCQHGKPRALLLRRKNDFALPAILRGGPARGRQGGTVAGKAAGRAHPRRHTPPGGQRHGSLPT